MCFEKNAQMGQILSLHSDDLVCALHLASGINHLTLDIHTSPLHSCPTFPEFPTFATCPTRATN